MTAKVVERLPVAAEQVDEQGLADETLNYKQATHAAFTVPRRHMCPRRAVPLGRKVLALFQGR